MCSDCLTVHLLLKWNARAAISDRFRNQSRKSFYHIFKFFFCCPLRLSFHAYISQPVTFLTPHRHFSSYSFTALRKATDRQLTGTHFDFFNH